MTHREHPYDRVGRELADWARGKRVGEFTIVDALHRLETGEEHSTGVVLTMLIATPDGRPLDRLDRSELRRFVACRVRETFRMDMFWRGEFVATTDADAAWYWPDHAETG